MSLTHDQVRHIAKLARLRIPEEQLEKMAGQLSAILDYVDALQKVDTEGVEPTAQVTGQMNVLRPDTVVPSEAASDALLGCSPLPIVDRQIQTPSTH